jgi:hypothetical protein
VLEAIFGGGSGTFSSSVSEDDDEEDENALVGEYELRPQYPWPPGAIGTIFLTRSLYIKIDV